MKHRINKKTEEEFGEEHFTFKQGVEMEITKKAKCRPRKAYIE